MRGEREVAEAFLREWCRPYFGNDRADAVACVARVLGPIVQQARTEALAPVLALADEWATEGPSLIRNAYSPRDVHEGQTLERCAADLRTAVAEGKAGRTEDTSRSGATAEDYVRATATAVGLDPDEAADYLAATAAGRTEHHRKHNRCGIGDPAMCGHPDCPDMAPVPSLDDPALRESVAAAVHDTIGRCCTHEGALCPHDDDEVRRVTDAALAAVRAHLGGSR